MPCLPKEGPESPHISLRRQFGIDERGALIRRPQKSEGGQARQGLRRTQGLPRGTRLVLEQHSYLEEIRGQTGEFPISRSRNIQREIGNSPICPRISYN